jgi:lipopolysaccharide transport system ATP-binding protein
MSDFVIKVEAISKAYRIWHNPIARLQAAFLHAVEYVMPALREYVRLREAKLYRDFYALNNVSLSMKRGETLGIIGRNGSGKSTLLQIISGTLAPTQGKVHLNGRVAALLELGSGFNPEFSGRENVYLNAAILGLTETEIQARYEEIVAFADIGEFMDQPVKTYSSGMTMRLAFAVVAHVDADVLIIDEALAVGDAFFVQKCMRWIRQFKERGTLLFVAHNAADIVALCDRAVWLRDGCLALEGGAKMVTEEYLAYFNQASNRAGKIAQTKLKPPASIAGSELPLLDQRERWLKISGLRNDIKVFEFDDKQPSYGAGGATLVEVVLASADDGRRLSWIVGGEAVCLSITARANEELADPILGFYLKDRLGQNLFGENTHLTNLGKNLILKIGDLITAQFYFQMPVLPRGQYVVTPAIATGRQDSHIQQHWIHEALILESASAHVHLGLIGIPMQRITTTLG